MNSDANKFFATMTGKIVFSVMLLLIGFFGGMEYKSYQIRSVIADSLLPITSSLDSARAQADDAKVKANVSNARVEAVLIYDSNAFITIMPEIEKLEHLNPEMINEFFKRLQTRKRIIGKDKEVSGVKNSTVKTYWSKLNIFFKWLYQNGYLKQNPLASMMKPPEPRYEDERALKKDQVDRIIAAVCMNNINSLLMKRDMAIVSTLLFAGIRKGELLGLQVRDLNFEKGDLTVRGETSKSKCTRIIPMNPTLMMHIKTYLEVRKNEGYKTPYLWVSGNEDKELSSHGLKHWVARYNKLSGVNFHLHQFRHTFACTLLENNVHLVKIQRLMGHKDIKMTQVYLRSITVSDCREEINKLSFLN